VPARLGVAARERLRLQLRDRVAVLGVDEHEQPALARDLHRLEQVLVGRVQRRALVGHEDLHGRDAELGQRRQLLLDVVGQVRDRDVQAEVDARLLGLALPRLDGLAERAVGILEREVDEHRRAARDRRGGARVPVVGRDRAAEWHVHVRVAVDEPRHHLGAGAVDDLSAVARQVDPDRLDRLAAHGDIRGERALGGHHGAAGEEQVGHA
jgi:hypothetical protein